MAVNGNNTSIPTSTQYHDFAIDNNSESDARRSLENAADKGKEAGRHLDLKEAALDQSDDSSIDQDGISAQPGIPKKKREGPVRWRDLPQKRQLFILAIARLSEPLVQTSLQVRSHSPRKKKPFTDLVL